MKVLPILLLFLCFIPRVYSQRTPVTGTVMDFALSRFVTSVASPAPSAVMIDASIGWTLAGTWSSRAVSCVMTCCLPASVGWIGAAALGAVMIGSVGFEGFGPLAAALAFAAAAGALLNRRTAS